MNLVQLSSLMRKLIVLGIVLIFLIIAYFSLRPSVERLYANLFPEENPPTPIYGVLQPVEFIEKRINGTAGNFELNTRTGTLPTNIPNKLPVYRFNNEPTLFSSGRRAQENAATLGFSSEELISDLEGDIYKWRDQETGAILEIAITTQQLVLESSYKNLSGNFPPRSINASLALGEAERLFNELGRFNNNYENGSQEVKLGRYSTGGIVETETSLDAQLARVDFYREINDYPILGPDPEKGQLHTILGRNQANQTNYLTVEAYYWEIIPQTNATYPIIPVSTAWDQVRQGNGVIVSVESNAQSPFDTYRTRNLQEIIINDIYIAYYETRNQQEFLQPIYVFEGNYNSGSDFGDVTIYYPAIDGRWIEQPAEEDRIGILDL